MVVELVGCGISEFFIQVMVDFRMLKSKRIVAMCEKVVILIKGAQQIEGKIGAEGRKVKSSRYKVHFIIFDQEDKPAYKNQHTVFSIDMFSCFESTVPPDSQQLVLDISPQDHVETSSNLTVVCYTDTNKRFVRQCNFKWKRIVDGSVVELQDIKGNSYMCQPDDLGSVIQVEITTHDQQKPGNTVITFGPVEMDLTLKPNIENIMVADSCREIVKISDYGETRECYLSISSKSIQISDLENNRLLEVDYFVDSPVFKINPKQPNKVSIQFLLPSYQQLKQFYNALFKRATSFEGKSIGITFVNRISRDMFIFAHKVLSSKKDLKVSELLMALEQRNRLKNLLNINSLLVVQYLRRDLKRYIKMYHEEKNQKDTCMLEVQRLQEQIANVRNSYTTYIKDCLRQLHPYTEDSLIEELNQRNFEYNFQEENRYLKFKIVKMNEEIMTMRKVERTKTTKKIFVAGNNLNSNLNRDLDEQVDASEAKQRIKFLERENLEISRKFASLLADYEDLKFQKQELEREKLDCSFRSTQSQEAITTINKLIGDIVELKRVNAELAFENEKLAGKKKQSSLDTEPSTTEKLEVRLRQTQRLLEVSQESYQRMKEMFEKTQAKYDSPRSSSYQSSVSSVSTKGRNKKKLQTPKRKSSVKKPAKVSLECK